MANQPITTEELLDLTGQIYASAVEPHSLPGLLRSLQGALGSSISGKVDASAGIRSIVSSLRALYPAVLDQGAATAFRRLLPHLEKAAFIQARLELESQASDAAVEMMKVLPMPCLFTDQQGRCIERNPAFNESADLLSLRIVVGRIRFLDPDLHMTWETALAETYATATGQTIVATASSGKPWRMHLVPLHTVMNAGDPANGRLTLVVFDERPIDAQLTAEAVQSKARLTGAELDVLAGLLQGLPAKVIASQRGASVNTVRAQIMSILDKTGHSSQRELMAAFSNSTFGNSTFSASSPKLGGGGSSFGPRPDPRPPGSRRG